MKNILYFLIFSAIFLASAGAPLVAEEQEIHVIDMQRAINESILGKAAKASMEAEIRKSESKLAVVKGEVDQLKVDFQKQAALLSEDALTQKQEKITEKEKQLARMVQDNREELTRKNDQEMKKIVSEIDKAIAQLSSGGKYPLIIEKDPRFVVYVGEKYDLTGEVVKILNSKNL